MITIIDYGMGNLGSVLNMYKRIGLPARITSDPGQIKDAEKIILPGVGAFDAAMDCIHNSGMTTILNQKVKIDKIPTLGICLGMQLLFEGSEEGIKPGLGWIKGKAYKFQFPNDSTLKIPHMGWNKIKVVKESPLIQDLPDHPKFYFVHSYFVKCHDEGDVLCTTPYGTDFHSIVQHENVYGAQFHPEKSHKFGMKLLENFATLC